MKRIVIFLSGILLVLGMVLPAMATTITYKLSDLSGGHYRYDYTVNTTLSQPLDFLIYFPDAYSSDASNYHLESYVVPTGWTGEVIQPGSIFGILYSGYFEAYNGSIPAGSSLSGFGVDFTYSGSKLLGSQHFEFDNNNNFKFICNGYTIPASSGAPVPEPATIILFALGIAGFGIARKKGNKMI